MVRAGGVALVYARACAPFCMSSFKVVIQGCHSRSSFTLHSLSHAPAPTQATIHTPRPTPLAPCTPMGAGAAVVTFRKPPRVKYRVDFGAALGGQYVAGIIKPFINFVINNVIVNMFVWPQRFVVPIIATPEMAVEVAKLAYRSVGVVKVRGACSVFQGGGGGGGVAGIVVCLWGGGCTSLCAEKGLASHVASSLTDHCQGGGWGEKAGA